MPKVISGEEGARVVDGCGVVILVTGDGERVVYFSVWWLVGVVLSWDGVACYLVGGGGWLAWRSRRSRMGGR